MVSILIQIFTNYATSWFYVGLVETMALLYLPSISGLIAFLSNSVTRITSFIFLVIIFSLFTVSSILTFPSLHSVQHVCLIRLAR